MKWLEINIERPADVSKNDFLISTIEPILENIRNDVKIESWHFLWKGKPYPSTLKLRFQGTPKEIKRTRDLFEMSLEDLICCYG